MHGHGDVGEESGKDEKKTEKKHSVLKGKGKDRVVMESGWPPFFSLSPEIDRRKSLKIVEDNQTREKAGHPDKRDPL